PARRERRAARRFPRPHAGRSGRTARRTLRPRVRRRPPAAAGRAGHGWLLRGPVAPRLSTGGAHASRRASDEKPTPGGPIIRAMPTPQSSREPWLFAIFALLVIGVGIGLRQPWPADEPRFVLVAKQMWESGDWWFPHRG